MNKFEKLSDKKFNTLEKEQMKNVYGGEGPCGTEGGSHEIHGDYSADTAYDDGSADLHVISDKSKYDPC